MFIYRYLPKLAGFLVLYIVKHIWLGYYEIPRYARSEDTVSSISFMEIGQAILKQILMSNVADN